MIKILLLIKTWIRWAVLVTNVSSYGYTMHKYLGQLTDDYLQQNKIELYNKVLNLLNGNSISQISSWADIIKRNPKWSWTKDLHYIDILECNYDKYDNIIINKYCNQHCIVSALQNFTNSIKYNFNYNYIFNDENKLTNVELLKFIIHFIQDLSQPMHLLGYDRGGNSFKVNVFIDGKNRTSNLHYIWDSMLPEYFIKHYNYTISNNTFTTPDNYYKLLESILNDNIQIACKVYPDSHYIIFNEYFNNEYFIKLFDNYQLLVVKTLKYIFT